MGDNRYLVKRIAELEAEVKEREHHSGLQDEFIHSLTGRAEAAEAENAALKSVNVNLDIRHNQDQMELSRLREANRWIPVEERLPKLGQEVLVRAHGETVICSYEGDCWHISGHPVATFQLKDVTHWRPLPEGSES